jgi:hypothetical protein
VVDRDAAVLDVGAHPELVGTAEQDRHPPGPAVGEQGRLGRVGPGLMHPADAVGGDPGGDQAAAQLAVDLRPGAAVGRAQVAEDNLERAGHGRGVAVLAGKAVVAGLPPDGRHPLDDRADLAGVIRGDSDQLQVQGGAAAVVADRQHVVVVAVDPAGADDVGPLDQPGHEGPQLGCGGHDHGVELGVRGGQPEAVAGADVGDLAQQGAQLGDVGEVGRAAVQPERAAVGGDLDLGLELDEHAGEGVEAVDAQLRQPAGHQVGQEHVQLGQAVGDRGAGEEGPAAAGRVAAAQPPQLQRQVGGALGRLDVEALHAGWEPEPLEVVAVGDEDAVGEVVVVVGDLEIIHERISATTRSVSVSTSRFQYLNTDHPSASKTPVFRRSR